MQVTSFLNDPMANCCFIAIIFSIERKCILVMNLATVLLTLEVQIVSKISAFQCYMEIEMMQNS